MFDRRLKIILALMCLALFGLMTRAAQIQVFQRVRWAREAADLQTLHRMTETTRGRILDARGRELAVDQPCIDACVDFAAITEDWEQYKDWLRDHAIASCVRRYGDAYSKATPLARQQMVAQESPRIQTQVHNLWAVLAAVSGRTLDDMDSTRQEIEHRVEMRRQYVQWQNYQHALSRRPQAPAARWYSQYLPTGSTGDRAPQLDDYSVDVTEQREAHIILPAIDDKIDNELARNADNLPGLVLRPGLKRVYPGDDAACHVIGHLVAVGPEQVSADPDESNPLRKYWPSDLVGQGGIEQMCELTLRGSRGEEITDSSGVTTQTPSIPGRDVRLSIDIELQRQIETDFAERRELHDGPASEIRQRQPGAAVVIDVETGNVLALVSYPTFNLNSLKQDYARLSVDDYNQPLLDRAVQAHYEPGSTVKPMMALGALADGQITPQTTIHCNGYLVLNGHQFPNGRCWTMREYGVTHSETSGEPLPGNLLRVPDAIERSCNVFFETVADGMGMVRQRYWYDRFGLGRRTGIGIDENAGHLPNPQNIPAGQLRQETWSVGIGQGDIAVTPLQMANVAATIARDGVWMRPRLTADAVRPEDRVDLHFSRESLDAVKDGMYRVVNNVAGTGHLRHEDDSEPDPLQGLKVAGKTGTPQASRLTIPVRDEQGHILLTDEGRERRQLVDPKNPAVNTWYIGGGADKSNFAHHWFVGYAPADHPKIAIAVFAEYGGDGFPVASSIARDVLVACLKQRYLSAGKPQAAP